MTYETNEISPVILINGKDGASKIKLHFSLFQFEDLLL